MTSQSKFAEAAGPIRPFLKWPGGKRWASERIASIVRARLAADGTYYEPFLGSGAAFFAIRPKSAVISDINEALVNVFLTIQANPRAVLRGLKRIPVDRDTYYRMRQAAYKSPVSRTIQFLYLNRTAFGGMYRLNKAGQFNVPFNGGERGMSILCESDLLLQASEALKNTRILAQDFEPVMRRAVKGDVVYCDPTYTVAHSNNGFVRYNEKNFSWSDQERLSRCALEAVHRGVTVIVSNAFHASIHGLYRRFTRHTLERTSRICPNPEHRKRINESLFIASLGTRITFPLS